MTGLQPCSGPRVLSPLCRRLTGELQLCPKRICPCVFLMSYFGPNAFCLLGFPAEISAVVLVTTPLGGRLAQGERRCTWAPRCAAAPPPTWLAACPKGLNLPRIFPFDPRCCKLTTKPCDPSILFWSVGLRLHGLWRSSLGSALGDYQCLPVTYHATRLKLIRT